MRLPSFLFIIAVVFSSVPAAAQDESTVIVRQTLLPGEFARFAPRSALDMARQVPGFSISEGGGDRGFGQADTNVLVNSRRISGKSNGPVDALSRIPVDDLVRLEIVDGASLDIGGLSGQVLNVVTAADGKISGQFRYSPQVRTDDVPFRWGNATLALSGGKGPVEWTLNLSNDQQRFGSAGPETVFDGNDVVLDVRDEVVVEEFDQPSLAGSFTRVSDNGSVLNLTGEINWFLFEFEELSERNPIGDIASVRTLRDTEDEFNFELGGDYAFDLGRGRLKLIGLHRYEFSPTESRVETDFADDRPVVGSFFEREADEAETVLRGEYTLNALGGDWQWSLEGTHNYLDIEAALSVSDDAGVLMPVDLPGASQRVEEDRAEMTLSYSRALTPRLQLQTSLGAEYSEISQIGAMGQTRDFVRPNGFVSLNWRASDTTNLSVQLERRVGQLNFFDFVASVNVNDDLVNVSNSDLVPPQSYLLNLELQQSFGSYGSMTLSGFYEDITDIVDQIPIEGGGQAPGNIDTAERYGASLNLTLLSEPLGWRGARADIEADYVDSEVADPLTGNSRQISGDDHFEYEVTLRQDFPDTTWAIGLEAFYNEDTPQVRLDQESLFLQSTAFGRLFVENKDVFGMTVRASVGNVFDRSNDFFRTIYNDRAANDIAFREDRFREFGKLIRVDVEGNF